MKYDNTDTVFLWSLMTTFYALEYSFYKLDLSLFNFV
jgi:hypothetical protein